MSESGGNNPGLDKFATIKGGATSKDNRVSGKVFLGSMDNGPFVEAQFNPKEIEVAKNVPWSKVNEANKSNQKSDQGQGIHLEFTGAEGRSLSLELLFDGAEPQGNGRTVDVQKEVAKLQELTSVRVPGATKEEEKRPHRCMVVWGDVINMTCVIESLSVKYTMFDPGGKPLRATCMVKLKEADVVSGKKKPKPPAKPKTPAGGGGAPAGGGGGAPGGGGGGGAPSGGGTPPR